MASTEKVDAAKAALERIQQFDPQTLSQEEGLGTKMGFAAAIGPAETLVGLYKRIPLDVLDDLTESQLDRIIQQTNSDHQLFEQILAFDPNENDAATTRTTRISTLEDRRDQLFEIIWQFIAYGVARSTDASLLETQARATIQAIKDDAKAVTDDLNASRDEATAALEAIRAVAAEQGVSQQAAYFKKEAEEQESLAATWLKRTYGFAAGVGAFATASLFFHKIDWLAPASRGELLQLITSKVLVFAVLGYLLLMAARNYSAHKHNAVVNRHRENALITYRALAEAASEGGTADIVLAHAAACIFSPQETGFSQRKDDTSAGSKSVFELMTRGATSAARGT